MPKQEAPISGTRSSLPEGFDYDNAMYSYRYHLMCMLRWKDQDIFKKVHDHFLKTLKNELLVNAPADQVERLIGRITMSAYNTIPNGFWTAVEKMQKTPEVAEKPKTFSKKKTKKRK